MIFKQELNRATYTYDIMYLYFVYFVYVMMYILLP
jgi:hypothetical protein